MGIKLGFKNKKDDAASVGADLAAFENDIVNLDKTGVLPELNADYTENVPVSEEEVDYPDEDFEDFEDSVEVDEDFDQKYSDEEAEESYGDPEEASADNAEEYFEDESAEDYAEADYEEDPAAEDTEYADEPTEEYVEADYEEDPVVEDTDYEEEPVAEDKKPVYAPADDEYIDLDRNVSDSVEHRKIKLNKPSKSTVIKISVIAAACILLALLVVVIPRLAKNNSGHASGTYVNGIYVSETMQGAGSEISDIGMIGERGLVAALDARMAAMVASADVAGAEEIEVSNDYGETELKTSMSVSIELVTVKSDLKIRFLNTSTGKLIPNVPFKVSVTDPSGKKVEWSDDDLDGIIYKTGIAEGKYTVHAVALEGDKYSGYTWPSDKSANVRSTIAYSSVDVKNEVKKADQVNEAAEDTSSRGGTSQLDGNDTVKFVESTSAPEYKEIGKDNITNPLAALDINAPFQIVMGTENNGNGDNKEEENKEEEKKEENKEEEKKEEEKKEEEKKEEEKPAEKPTVKLSLSQSSQKITVGSSFTFTASYEVTVAPGCELKVSSSDSSIATASISDKTITVKGVKAGSADITVVATTTTSDKVKDTASASAKCSVTVGAEVDLTTPLKDNSGNEVYVLEDGKYRKATYADYSKFDKFYIISGTKYTGWQTINGATYFYDSEGKVVTGTQTIQGVTYQFAADGKMMSTSGVLGIDVSKWNGSVDWNAVKAAGVQYVIIRVGYRGSTAGALIDDSKFATNIAGAKAAGLGVGVYFVTQAVNDVEAVYEASMVLDRIKGYSLEYPVFLDVEPSGGRGDLIDKATRTAVCIAFCETIRNAGYTPGIYANKTWFETKMNASQLSSYKIWVAHYSSVCGYTGRYDYWQYSDKGKIAGVSGNVDMNLKYT